MQAKTFSTYFHFFENKSRHLKKAYQTFLLVGLGINLLAVVLINFGVLHRPVSKVTVKSTPAPMPDHFLDAGVFPQEKQATHSTF